MRLGSSSWMLQATFELDEDKLDEGNVAESASMTSSGAACRRREAGYAWPSSARSLCLRPGHGR
jgi:hypothetical protein